MSENPSIEEAILDVLSENRVMKCNDIQVAISSKFSIEVSIDELKEELLRALLGGLVGVVGYSRRGRIDCQLWHKRPTHHPCG